MEGRKILLMCGSPRKKGTSFSFARTIKLLVEEGGSTAELVHIIDCFDGKESFDAIKRRIAESDVLAIIAPLYSDTLPYPNIWLMERLANECSEELKGKDFFAVGQCGFPDATRLEPLLDSCRLFAEETGMRWLGGLAYGGGSIINGQHLEDMGKKGAKIISGFRLATESILKGEKIDSHAQQLITLKIPKGIYWLLAAYLNSKARKLAKASGNIDYKRRVYME